jgi:ATP-dependent helicase YprA (DUF1998 family)
MPVASVPEDGSPREARTFARGEPGLLGEADGRRSATSEAADLRADLVVLTATAPKRFTGVQAELREVAGGVRLAVGGAGASAALAAALGADLLDGDPVGEAERIAADH